jgi:hypothetical protein
MAAVSQMVLLSYGGAAPAAVSFIALTHDTGNVTTYTFSGASLGAEAADRYIFVTITAASSTGTARTISSGSIGGVAASIAVQQGAASSSGMTAAIMLAAVPTGTTGDVVVTLSGAGGSCDIGVYRVTGLGSATAFDTAVNSDEAGGGVVSTTIDVPGNGFVIGVAMFEADVATTTWVGASENYDESNGDGSPEIVTAAMSSALGAETGRTVSATSTVTSGNDCTLAVGTWA